MGLDNLRHPLRTARTAKAWLAAHSHMWKFGHHGRRRYRDDTRYDLQNVTKGFTSRIDESSDDTEVLERICAAYSRAIATQQQLAPDEYEASWRRQRQGPLSTVIRALLERNTVALSRMYRNFYRDPCSSGLLAAPNGMSKAYFSRTIKDIYRHFYLTHVLYRLDYWRELTEHRFRLQDLAGPGIGNPFGVVIEGTLITVGAEYAHYCAHRVHEVADSTASAAATVAEIGGGFGGVAYYLLCTQRPLRYINFDIPESVALCSYYLMKALPALRFLLFGEKALTEEAISHADVVLMPTFELEAIPARSVDITFSSYALSNLSGGAMGEYLKNVVRMTRQSMLYIGDQKSSDEIAGLLRKGDGSFTLTDTRTSGWRSRKVSGAGMRDASGLAGSMSCEQRFLRMAPS